MTMSPARCSTVVLTAALLLTVATLLAQHEYTPTEIEDGGRLFLASCAACHGADGDAVPGVDLGHGQFRRASADEDLIKIIIAGIPGTAMPPNNFTEMQAGTIVAYLRSLAASEPVSSVPGDTGRGQALFEGKGTCLTCHRVRGNGSRLGPDLSDIGLFRRAVELQRSVLDPAAEILPANRSVRAVTRDGATITGKLLNHDSFTLELLDAKDQLRSFSKANLREYIFLETTSMPSYRDKLSAQELADLVRYLVSLKNVKVNNP